MIEINKIYLGDCMGLMKQIPSESINLILTDPPYGIDFLSSWSNHHHKIENDSFDKWKENLPIWLQEFKRIITPTGVICCFQGGGGKLPTTAIFTLEAIKYFHLIQTLVWIKFIGLGWKYRPAYENIVILSKSKDDYNFYDTSNSCSNVIMGINQEIPIEGEHPTKKPEALIRKLLKIHSKEGDLVLDPFMGGGTTPMCCKQLNRKYIGIEISEDYYKIAKERLRQRTLIEEYPCHLKD